MRKIQIKRVCLVGPRGQRMDYAQDFFPTLSDHAILSMFYETGKSIWIGDTLYKIQRANGMIRHYPFEVYTVTRYVKGRG